jgi:hypothetical protein
VSTAPHVGALTNKLHLHGTPLSTREGMGAACSRDITAGEVNDEVL